MFLIYLKLFVSRFDHGLMNLFLCISHVALDLHTENFFVCNLIHVRLSYFSPVLNFLCREPFVFVLSRNVEIFSLRGKNKDKKASDP